MTSRMYTQGTFLKLEEIAQVYKLLTYNWEGERKAVGISRNLTL